MKIFLLTSLLLTTLHATAAHPQHKLPDDGPFAAFVKTMVRGGIVATAGYGLKELVNFSTADYTLTFPSSVVPTTESRLGLVALGCIGGGLIFEKIYRGKKESCFEQFLELSNADKNRRVGHIIELGIAATVAYELLTNAANQSPADAGACIAAGGLLELLR
jgi:hypothetical protein